MHLASSWHHPQAIQVNAQHVITLNAMFGPGRLLVTSSSYNVQSAIAFGHFLTDSSGRLLASS